MNCEIIVSVFSFILSIFVFAFYLIDRHFKMVEISMNYRTQVLEWYEKCIQILKLILVIKDDKKELEKAKARFSGLIEQGRFFFPNIDKKDGFGNEKVLHHRGYSNIIINFLYLYLFIANLQSIYFQRIYHYNFFTDSYHLPLLQEVSLTLLFPYESGPFLNQVLHSHLRTVSDQPLTDPIQYPSYTLTYVQGLPRNP